MWDEANLCVSVHRGSAAGCGLLQQLAGAEVCRGYFGRHRRRDGGYPGRGPPSARQALAEGAELCDKMREGMNHLLRTQDFTELEAALRAADGHLELSAPEEAFGELRRAQVQVETLEWLSRRLV